MMRYIVCIIGIGIFLFTGCANIYTKPLAFISPDVHFGVQEAYQTDKLRCRDSFVYHTPKDSFVIGKEYTYLTLKSSPKAYRVNDYLFQKTTNDAIDYVVFDYYNGYLICIEIYSKDKNQNTELLKQTENHFGKKFKWYNHNDSIIMGSLEKKAITTYSFIYPNGEMHLMVNHYGYRNPFVCRVKRFRKLPSLRKRKKPF